MLNRPLKYIWFIALTLLVGCRTANEGPAYIVAHEPENGDALVYLYQIISLPKSHSPTIYINQTKVVDLSRNEYTYLYVKPGKYVIRNTWPSGAGITDQEIQLSAIAGETYYVRLSGTIEFSSPETGEFNINNVYSLELISKDIARSDLSKCTYFQPLIERLQ